MKNKPLLTIFLVVFIDLLGFGIIIPILPYYAVSFDASPTVLGWLMMSYSAMQFLFSPFWGRLSDRIGRRPVLLICIAGIGASMFLLGMAQSLVWLFAARILAGFFGANISAASAYIADITKPEERAKGMGLIGAAFGLGFLFGPAAGGLLSEWGYGTAAYVAAGLSAINWIFAFFVLREPAVSREIRAQHRTKLARVFIMQTLKTPKVGTAIFLFFLVTFGMAQIEMSFALFVLERFHLGAMEAGLILALMALVMALFQGTGIGKMARLMGEKKLILHGCFLMAVAVAAAALVPGLGIFVFFVAVHALGYGMTTPSLSSLVSRNSSAEIQGGALGIYQSAGSLGRILGPLLGGVLFDRLGAPFPFLSASLFFAVAFILALRE
ncbi:MAG: MFS transporter [Deltaproteobacteria bacterium]|nr:MFS transporter [Deltaproteobacteria bacterium]